MCLLRCLAPRCGTGTRAFTAHGKNRLRLLRVARRRFRLLCCMLSYLEGTGLIGVNRTARRVPVALDNAVAAIWPLSLIAMAELRWYVSVAAPISLLRSVIVP